MKRAIVAIILLGIGFFLGYVSKSKYQSHTSAHEQKKALYWVAPMDPSYRRDAPGKSPMGMDLVPIYEDKSTEGMVKIDPTIEHNLGVKTAKVTKKDLSREIQTVGSIQVDENLVEYVHVYAEGWIKELFVKAEGDSIEKGQLLFKIFSPKINTAQDEYLLAIKNGEDSLVSAAKAKLKAFGLTEKQVDDLREEGKAYDLIDVYAAEKGTLSKVNIAEGKFVKPEQVLMVIEDLSKVWMIAEVYERQANWAKEGQDATASFAYLPGKEWKGKVNYIYPNIDPVSQTLQLRLAFDNPQGDLKLNMFGDVKIYSSPKEDVLAIPKDAVIYAGKMPRVVLKNHQGSYFSQEVMLGDESGDFIQVMHGLKEGDEVVTSAQFLIDSESNLNASIKRLEKAPKKHHTMHQH